MPGLDEYVTHRELAAALRDAIEHEEGNGRPPALERIEIVATRAAAAAERANKFAEHLDESLRATAAATRASTEAIARLEARAAKRETAEADLVETMGVLTAAIARLERKLGLVETTANTAIDMAEGAKERSDAAIDVARVAREGSDAGSLAFDLAALEVTRRQDSITLRREREREKIAIRRAQWTLVGKVVLWATTGGGILAILALGLRACGVDVTP